MKYLFVYYYNGMIKSLHKNNVSYDNFRITLKKELKKISSFLKYPNHFTVQTILFPHVWQRKINGSIIGTEIVHIIK